MISRVFVVNNNDNKLIRLPLDNFGLLQGIDCSTCDIAYDVRTFDENVVYYARYIFLIVNDKDYNYFREKLIVLSTYEYTPNVHAEKVIFDYEEEK